MNNEIVPFDARVAVEDVKRLANLVLSLRDDVFKDGLDFGIIPGTGNKPTLLLPGMEKLLRALRLRPEYVEKSRIEDFDKNLIYYRYECRLIDYETGLCVSTAIGSANSHESKWRWRDQKRACPKCQKETINRSKFPPKGSPTGTEPGWYCYGKVGGCGAEFNANDPAITTQSVGRIENPDIFDQMNTIDKIAQKRALSSAIKGAANVSEFFTVDLEDFVQYDTARPLPENVVDASFTVVTPEQSSAKVSGAGVQKPQLTAWADDPKQLADFFSSALDKFKFTQVTVLEILDALDTLEFADWRTSRGWALAALVAEYCENNTVKIDQYTSSMGGNEDAALTLRDRANQIAVAHQHSASFEAI